MHLDTGLLSWVEDTMAGAVVTAHRGYAGGSRSLWYLDVDVGGVTTPAVLRTESGEGAFAETPFSLQREADVYRALADTGVPIATLYGADGTQALLLERLAGRSQVHDLTEAAATEVLGSLVDALARLHGLDPGLLHLPRLARPQAPADHALSDLGTWRATISDHLNGGEPLMAYALGWLEHHAPPSVSRSVLVHGDFGPGNFLFDNGRVTGLVDWEFSHIGDPMDDIAWLDFRCASLGPPFGLTSLRDDLYRAATGLEVDSRSLRYYAAFVRLRCVTSTGLAISGGGGALGRVAYFPPHHRFLAELGMALAAAEGLDLPDAAIPVASPPEDALAQEILKLRETVLPGLSDAGAKLQARGRLLQLEHEQVKSAIGDAIAEENRADVEGALGRPVAAPELLKLAGTAGAQADPEVLHLLIRIATRERALWDTPAARRTGTILPLAQRV